MRNLKFYFLALLLAVTFGCSKDSTETEDQQLDIVELEFKAPTSEVKVLIEYHDWVDDRIKDKVRDEYKRNGVLVRYEECDKFWDAWVINCPSGACSKEAPHENDTPVKDDPDPVSRNPIKSVIKFKECKDL